jgi:hypothetical protein
MRKVFVLLIAALSFYLLTKVFVFSIEAKWSCCAHKWMVEYGCKGSGCVSGRYVSEDDRYDADGKKCSNCTTYYTPAGIKITDPITIAEDYAKINNGKGPLPGQPGYIHGFLPNGEECKNMFCFYEGGAIKAIKLDSIVGFTKSYTNAPAQYAGFKFVPIISYSRTGSSEGGGGGAGTPTIVWVTATPTPTPTPTAAPGPWVKLKDTSFFKEERIESYIPASPVPYDADDTTEPYFIIGDGGLVNSVSPPDDKPSGYGYKVPLERGSQCAAWWVTVMPITRVVSGRSGRRRALKILFFP